VCFGGRLKKIETMGKNRTRLTERKKESRKIQQNKKGMCCFSAKSLKWGGEGEEGQRKGSKEGGLRVKKEKKARNRQFEELGGQSRGIGEGKPDVDRRFASRGKKKLILKPKKKKKKHPTKKIKKEKELQNHRGS